jgi:N-acetylglucosamine kinase-like BadF-type ATPase
MTNILVADSGSTKTQWILFRNGKTEIPFTSLGINPFYQDTDSIISIIKPMLIKNVITQPEHIFFYGAGCGNQKQWIVYDALKQIYPEAAIFVGSDLLGAARALCQNNSGIACILGTGSNSCFYDGKEIVSHVSPLGYILGDEGSGAVLGKKLISDILKNQLPEVVSQRFFDTYQLNVNSILDSAYKQPFPNRYLAQFSKFISENIELPEIENIVMESFEEFISRNIMQYEQVGSTGIYFTGSISWYFREQLEASLEKFGLTAVKITKAPLEDLISYHKTNLQLSI